MILYSVTVSIEAGIHTEWLDWMQNVHIPDVMQTGYFVSHQIHRLLDPPPEPGSFTYNIQYRCESVYELQQYQEKAAPALQADHTDKFKGKFVAFRTILKTL